MDTIAAVDLGPITDITADLASVAGPVVVGILAVGGSLIGIAAAAGAALKWGPGLVSKFFRR